MDEVNYQKIIFKTFLKLLLMIFIFVSINNWPQIKGSIHGEIPPLNVWLDHSIRVSNVFFIIVATIYFFYVEFKKQKELVDGHSN
ncbi:hypothetical protein [Pedobacter mendelii]|uniref:hypothetical protein n=1 Tax=Pedobacter mendelii TaxID=1908240 RepID=UPI0016697BCB|nr:hypothetical protein [Pedobacter mendelii]